MNVPALTGAAQPLPLPRLVQSLAFSQNVELQVRQTASMKTIDSDGATAWTLDGGTRVSVKVINGADPREALQSTLDLLRSSLSPPPPRHVEDWLAELDAITAKRKTDTPDLALRLAAYRNRLCEYPAQSVQHVLTVQRWKFWPTWDELGAALDEQVADVRRMIEAIERELKPKPAAKPSKPARRMSGAMANEIIRGVYGDRFKGRTA